MILELYDWLSRGCPDGVPLRWLLGVWQWDGVAHGEFRSMQVFDDHFPWDTLCYEHDEYLVKRRAAS